MSSARSRLGYGAFGLIVCGLLAALPGSAAGQEPISQSGAVSVTGGIDLANRYIFRGVRQNATGIVAWPHLALAVRLLGSKGPLERLTIHAGFWNSLNTGDTGSGGPMAAAWYESRVSGGFDLQFDGGVSVATSYTTYVSPNDLFTTAREAGIRVTVDDRGWFGRAALRPYAFMAFELDTQPGVGQLDGGLQAGRYLEMGATPGVVAGRVSIAVPVKIGISLRDYYELGGEDHRFGFASIGTVASVPVGGATRSGQWRVRGGIDVYRLGDTTRAFNRDDRLQATVFVGIAVTR